MGDWGIKGENVHGNISQMRKKEKCVDKRRQKTENCGSLVENERRRERVVGLSSMTAERNGITALLF